MGSSENFSKAKIACAWYFICIGMAYGMLTSRMPALKLQTGADDMQVGFSLLAVGAASLVALFLGPMIIERTSCRTAVVGGAVAVVCSMVAVSLTASPTMLICACGFLGFAFGLTDMACNTQAIQIEQLFKTSCMATLHGSFSLGGVVASIGCAVAAHFDIGPTLNWSVMLAVCVLGMPAVVRHLLLGSSEQPEDGAVGLPSAKSAIPFGIVLIGILAMFAYAIEGSVAEWGAILLYYHKHVPQSTAALVYGAFSFVMTICRFFGDAIRNRIGNIPPLIGGAVLSGIGMVIVLVSDQAIVCLGGYTLMGIGVAPMAPVLMSLAGGFEGVSPERASSVVSLLAYGGMLMVPPLMGILSTLFTLPKALILVLVACVLLLLGSILLGRIIRKPAA